MSLLTLLNGALCAAMCVRLLSYHREGARFKPLASLVAFLMIGATGSVAIRVLYGTYGEVNVSELVLNSALCVALFSARGNVSRVYRAAGKGLS